MTEGKDCALLLGIGSIEEVLAVSTNLPPEQAAIAADLAMIGGTVLRIIETEGGFGLLAPLMCAILNTQFDKSGDFYRVTGTGGIERQYFSADSEREFIKMLAGI